ncbi:hypothetical protein SAMD00019534_065230 [Acytostelium subglobosum LB1]|uniref:hypothetical protein n=1 Tax=Acytostelium subglobosum LB1 TaxID=1410327 RepID=UPI000644A872|nr:hypothetical protein SAMD00019534_065230 [Acytostelium subglobosum LB1]GAM23348.1 hypothetical protein SAMD00019534_065230 [Acytostelium subglobosum LB1]|eukprot:XP_012753797.1 hypothetical protein SAMD00019534_065230 [Acytostelium subglobosum LB1]
MSSLSSVLPVPRQHYSNDEHPLFTTTNQQQQQKEKLQQQQQIKANEAKRASIPSYGQRKGWKPTSVDDYGDGGAYPEIHTSQFPLDMGRKKGSSTKGAAGAANNNKPTSTSKEIIQLGVDSSGRVKYEDVLGIDKNKILYSQYTDLIPKEFGQSEMERPTDEDTVETTNKTKAALEKIVNVKIAAAQPTSYVEKQAPVAYVKYTPSQQGGGHNSNASSRIIRMVEVAKDPMEPPKFKIKKDVKRPPSPPATIMHSPPRKTTVQDQQEWKVPPCISNWKNPNGFAIELDKRLAADGRNLQKAEINDKFAHFSQALYIAENNAREEVTARAELELKLAQKEKEKKQEMLRKMAEDAMNERTSVINKIHSRPTEREASDDENGGRTPPTSSRRETTTTSRRTRSRSRSNERNRRRSRSSSSDSSDSDSSDSEDEGRKDRDRIRAEKKREREREYRLEASGKKSKFNRDSDRDISEKIALGQVQAVRSEDSIFDQRLFNQSEGMSSGFNGGDDETYSVYSKPLFGDSVSSSIYRPRIKQDETNNSIEDVLSTSRFKPNKEFSGVDHNRERSGPVKFDQEKKKDGGGSGATSDPFGMDEFLSQVKKGGRDSDAGGRRR